MLKTRQTLHANFAQLGFQSLIFDHSASFLYRPAFARDVNRITIILSNGRPAILLPLPRLEKIIANAAW